MRQLWSMRAYFWSDRALSRFFNAVRTVHQGFWLGMLDREAFQQVDEHAYLTWKKLYDDRNYNLSGLWAWEASAVDRFFPNCQSILIAAAGGGREIIALVKRGFEVDAFDCSSHFVESCQQLLRGEGIEAGLFLALPDSVPEHLKAYDGIIVGWGAYMHIAGQENRVRFLTALHGYMREGGSLLVSFLTRAPNSHEAKLVFGIARTIRWLRRRRDDVELGDSLFGSFNHTFTRTEIERELGEGGFKLQFYAEQPYGHAVGTALPRSTPPNKGFGLTR